jgi:catechol 2,3-dioxygenase-like lactoylglutathione lyase family enzyme/dienelactone hydrolase
VSLVGFEHAGLTVADLDRTIAFYCGLLGLRLIVRKSQVDGELAFLDTGSGMLEIFGRPGAQRALDVPAGRAGVRHLTFAVDDVVATVGRLEAAGVEITERPRDAHNRELIRRVAFCRDPDGLQIELIERAPRHLPPTRELFAELLRLDRPAVSIVSSSEEHRDGYVLERLRLSIGTTEVRGLLTRPERPGRRPAILYGHSHGGRYDIGADELLDGREYLLDPLGPVFARAGYVTLCIDMPVFGERRFDTEAFASKALLWHGKSLVGQMLENHRAALDYLVDRPDVDPNRVGAFGISMGCTLSYWLAALDERIAAVAHLCCFADLRTMIELGAHDGHGIYLVVPGLLEHADAGDIAALIAPRPQLVCIGEADSLTPPLSVERAWASTRAAYDAQGGRLDLISEPGVGHQETARMREGMLRFFNETLGGPSRQ